MEPRIFKFGTPYEEMYKSLAATQDDAAFFVRNGVLQLCRRGAAVKVSVPQSRSIGLKKGETPTDSCFSLLLS